LPAFVYNR